eukprot:s851_g2.t2
MVAPPMAETMGYEVHCESEMDFTQCQRLEEAIKTPKRSPTPTSANRPELGVDKTPPALLSWPGSPWPEPGTQEVRKRLIPPGVSSDDCVAALLPKMKRMRLRPSLGQLRLQREAEENLELCPEVKVSVEPELLRASVDIECAAVEKGAIQFEISFPPQYPHRPPQVAQVFPDRPLPCYRYEGCLVVLSFLGERTWSSVLGTADIVRELLEPLPGVGGGLNTKKVVHSLVPPYVVGRHVQSSQRCPAQGTDEFCESIAEHVVREGRGQACAPSGYGVGAMLAKIMPKYWWTICTTCDYLHSPLQCGSCGLDLWYMEFFLCVTMDAELLRKLAQRLRIVEGNRAQVSPATPNNQPATGQFGQRKRVQVPQWVVHRSEASEGSTPEPVRQRSPRFSRGSSAGSDGAAEVQPVTTVEQLRQELEQMKQERDDAVQRADAAEAAAQSWGESLNAEAAHLRRLCSTMAQDQSAVSGQVSDLSARRQQADSLEEGDAIVDPHEELSALPRDITDLTVELSELRAQRTSLQARVSTLRQELEAQLAEEAEFCRLLHEAKGRNQAPSTTDGKDCPASVNFTL